MKECGADAALLQGVFVSGQERIRADAPLFMSSTGEEGETRARAALHWLNGLRAVLLSGPCSQVSFCKTQREKRGRADLILLWDQGAII